MQDLRSVEVIRELSRRVTQLEQNERKMKFNFEKSNSLLQQAIQSIKDLKKENQDLKEQIQENQEKGFSQLPQPPLAFDYAGLPEESNSDDDTENDDDDTSDADEEVFGSKTCWGCQENQPNQLAHMDKGGCLYFANSDDEDDPDDTALNTLIDEMDIGDDTSFH